MNDTAIPSDKSRWSSFDPLSEDIYLRGRALLDSKETEDDFESYKQIRSHYKACMNFDKLEELGIQPVLNVLDELGGWPVLQGEAWKAEDFNWWTWAHKVNKIGLGIDGIVTFSLGADDKNASWRVLGLDQATLGMNREYLVKGFEDKDVQHYYKFMLDTAVYLGATKEKAEEELLKSLNFEFALAEITLPREERRNATLLYNPTTVDKLPVYEGLPPSWKHYFQGIFDGTDVIIADDEKVIVTNFTYLERVSELIQKTDKRVVANYLAWCVAKSVITYLNEDGRDIRFKFDKAISGIEEKAPRWKKCVNEMGFNSLAGGGFGFVAGSMYARKYFKQEAKKLMVDMTNYIRKAFKEDILEHLDWMDEDTKARAEKKLEKMDQFIAYSDEFLDKEKVDGLHRGIEIADDEYLENTLRLIRFWRKFYYNELRDKVDPTLWTEHGLVTVVNAFYNPGQNNFEFPAGILQGAFFNAETPMYLNFGAIGTIIGHEITHGFDDQGKQRNENGKINSKYSKMKVLFC